MAAPTSPPPSSLARLDTATPLVGGVASRVSGRLGAGPGVVRLALVVLAVAGGIGLVGYTLAWLLLYGRDEPRPRPESFRHNVAVMALTTAALILITDAIPALPSTLLMAVHLVSFGLVLSAPRTQPTGRGATAVRVAAGLVFVLMGWVSVVADTGDLGQLWRSLLAATVMVAGVTVVLWPWLQQLAGTAARERAERIRIEERADVAAHLHDSVLQTLSLIQNRATEPHVVAALAHQQERELRRWLYGHSHPRADGTQLSLRPTLDELAADIEGQYLVVIDCIVVGDAELSPSVEAAVAATREALINAGKFSGSPMIALYAEAGPDRVEIFIRDRGQGFGPTMVPADRHGLRDSIQGRIERVGGTTGVRSEPGAGTEIRLVVPR